MAKVEDKIQKGNSSDTLLAIYVLRILKKYSSYANPLSAQQVLKYLVEEKYISENDNEDAQKKKVRRYLDTLHESYGDGCIVKNEGKNRKEGNCWYYDIKRDSCAAEENPSYETLSNEEIEFLVDIIASSKIINAKSTYDIINKLLKKTDLSEKEKIHKRTAIREEDWTKSINKEFLKLKRKLQLCIDDYRRIKFDCKGQNSIVATPYGWDTDYEGKYLLVVKIEGDDEFSSFPLDQIQNIMEGNINFNPDEDAYFDREDREPSDDLSLESLFVNIQKINAAIEAAHEIEFKYLSYVIRDEKVVWVGEDKRVLPRTMVFVDGKYYLIGLDESPKSEDEKIGYYRVDLISKIIPYKLERKLSDWEKSKFDGIKRSRDVETHPLMQAGIDRPVTFMVVESALDRVLDAFGKNAQFVVTQETKDIPIKPSIKKWYEKYSADELKKERLVKVFVRTTYTEAFRWSLANADAVELVYPLDLRYRLRRIAAPIQRSYVRTTDDQIRENVDRICESGDFDLVRYMQDTPDYSSGTFFTTPFHIGEELAYESYKLLSKEDKLDVVEHISIWNNNADNVDYVGAFKNTIYVEIRNSECKNPQWISEITGLKGLTLLSTAIESVLWLKELKELQNIELEESPIYDLSVLSEHEEVRYVKLNNIAIRDLGFIEKYQYLSTLIVVGCPIEDYSPLLKIPPLHHLEIDEKVVEALGMENIKKHHPDADIIVQQKILNYKG